MEFGAVWSWVLFGVWCCLEFGAVWSWVLYGVGCCMEFGAVWSLVLYGVGCSMALDNRKLKVLHVTASDAGRNGRVLNGS
jgi:hypothetical protein